MEKNTSVKGIYIFRIIMSTILAMLFFVLIIGEANAQSCPFSQQANRKIIYFPDPGPIVSNEDIAHATRAVAVPLTGPFRANISLYAYDSYPARYILYNLEVEVLLLLLLIQLVILLIMLYLLK